MKQDLYAMYIPLEIDDEILAVRENTEYQILDIVICHHTKDKSTNTVLVLKDLKTNKIKSMDYYEDDWKIIKYNSNKIDEEN